MKKNFMPAMATTELAIGVGIAVIVAIFAISLVGNNLSNFTKSGIMNFFKAENKTQYSGVFTDYADSQINVQITGAQGLEMIRQKANNKALALLAGSGFSNDNPNGNILAYYAKVVEILSGEPDFCSYMTKGSMLHCDEIGSYEYDVSVSGALTITSKAKGTISPAVDGSVSSAISDANLIVPLDNANYPLLNDNDKYEYLQYLTLKLQGLMNSKDLLVKIINTSQSGVTVSEDAKIKELVENGSAVENLKVELNNLASKLYNKLKQSHDKCTDDRVAIFKSADQDEPPSTHLYVDDSCATTWDDDYEDKFVYISDYKDFDVQRQTLNQIISNSQNTEVIVGSATYIFSQQKLIDILKKDIYYKDSKSETSCEIMKHELKAINEKYKTSIQIPSCEPNYN